MVSFMMFLLFILWMVVIGFIIFILVKVGVVDLVVIVCGVDGESIVDDVVNFYGGKFGDYYGIEIDF